MPMITPDLLPIQYGTVARYDRGSTYRLEYCQNDKVLLAQNLRNDKTLAFFVTLLFRTYNPRYRSTESTFIYIQIRF